MKFDSPPENMPFKKYHKHFIYRRFEKKITTPPPSASTSLQSVPLSTTGSFANCSSSNVPGSTRSSPSRSISSRPIYLDDDYNPYSYGLVPLTEENIYREFQVIEPQKPEITKLKQAYGINRKSPVGPTSSMSSLSSNTKSLEREKKTVRIVETKQQEILNTWDKKATSDGLTTGRRKFIIPIQNELSLVAEPVPTPIRSYKCTSYTLNEIRSF